MLITRLLLCASLLNPQMVVFETLRDMGRLSDYGCLSYIFQKESGWNPDTVGDHGQSFGLGQRHAPAHGFPPKVWAISEQTRWFVKYADARYGGVCEAAAAHKRKNWW